MLTERFDEALAYASRIHRSQKRKGTSIPYVSHLLAVASLTLEYGGNEDQAIAALLHDAVEDQGGLERLADIKIRFGSAVARIVSDCTDAWEEPKPPWRARKEAYLASLETKPDSSLLVSLADKTHNARAIVSDRRHQGESVWNRFNQDRQSIVWYYRELAETFAARIPGELADELRRMTNAMAAN